MWLANKTKKKMIWKFLKGIEADEEEINKYFNYH